MEAIERIKHIRKAKKLTLKELAGKTGLSVNFLSQMERGLANPSVASVKKITEALGLRFIGLAESLDSTTESIPREPTVVKSTRRKALIYPGGRRRTELLTPNLKGKLEVLLCVEDPEPPDEVDWYTHEGEEFGLVLEGTYEVSFKEKSFLLNEGDSITFDSTIPHSMRNPGDRPCKLLWVITPPSF